MGKWTILRVSHENAYSEYFMKNQKKSKGRKIRYGKY